MAGRDVGALVYAILSCKVALALRNTIEASDHAS